MWAERSGGRQQRCLCMNLCLLVLNSQRASFIQGDATTAEKEEALNSVNASCSM